jgi:hypothetical protein
MNIDNYFISDLKWYKENVRYVGYILDIDIQVRNSTLNIRIWYKSLMSGVNYISGNEHCFLVNKQYYYFTAFQHKL